MITRCSSDAEINDNDLLFPDEDKNSDSGSDGKQSKYHTNHSSYKIFQDNLRKCQNEIYRNIILWQY